MKSLCGVTLKMVIINKDINTAGVPCIIVLNWQSGEDTIECINSIIEHVKADFKLIVVDNNSLDNSKEIIQSYLVNVFGGVGVYSYGGDLREEIKAGEISSRRVIFVKNSVNGGYGAGNNIGIKIGYYLGCDSFWILNNDCVLTSDALSPLLQMVKSDGVGFVGSVITNSHNVIECYGGARIFPILGRTVLIKTQDLFEKLSNTYLSGASILVARRVIDDVGYINEGYFMYFEEVDWQFRGITKGYKLRVAKNSKIIHKSGEKIRGHTYYYYRARSSMLFIRRFYGVMMTIVSLFFMIITEAIQNILRPEATIWTIKGALAGIYSSLEEDYHDDNNK